MCTRGRADKQREAVGEHEHKNCFTRGDKDSYKPRWMREGLAGHRQHPIGTRNVRERGRIVPQGYYF